MRAEFASMWNFSFYDTTPRAIEFSQTPLKIVYFIRTNISILVTKDVNVNRVLPL
jgi:hypothetical protein